MKKLGNWIEGKWQPPVDGLYCENRNPATQEMIAQIPRSSRQDVHLATQAATRAFASWSQLPLEERAALCDTVANKIAQRSEELAYLESQDQGKPVSLAASMDIPRSEANFRFFAGAARHTASEFHPMSQAINYTWRRPLGVVALITPWNLPLYLLTWKVAPALVMGNTIVAKPSELTPMTASVLAEILAESGIPPGVFNLVHGLGQEAGQALIEHPDISAISFTGGTVTGRKIATTAAPQFKKLSLELGGKNPTIVFADCDLDAAIAGTVRAGFTNQGEVCLCGSRILIQRPIFETFVSALVERVQKLTVGDPSDPKTNLGALISLEHRDKVESYLQLATSEGGKILCGGTRPHLPSPWDQGAFLTPAVLSGLPHHCRVVQEEIFGPVVTVHPFDTEEEALTLANHVRYGLSASVWTQDLNRAHRFSTSLQVGMVWVNTWLMRDLRVPFGGSKESGVGREGGRYSLEFFSEASNICIQLPTTPISPQPPPLRREPQLPRPQTTQSGPLSLSSDYEEKVKAESTSSNPLQTPPELKQTETVIHIAHAPKPVGAYPHARRCGDLLFLSGIGPRRPKTNEIPGGPVWDADGHPLPYDVEAQTRSVIDNVRTVLEASGSHMEKIVDVSVYLIDMKRDFSTFNRVYAEHFSTIQATRTTIEVRALPTPIAVEFKVIATLS